MTSNPNRSENSLFLKNFKNKLDDFFNRQFNFGSVNDQGRSESNYEKSSEKNSQDSLNSFLNKNAKLDSLSNSSIQTKFQKTPSTNPMINRPNNKTLSTRSSRINEPSKQQVVSITYEEIGLFPRSFNRVFDRFFKQLFFDVDNLVIQEYRFYRYLFLTTVKCVFILLFVPLTINFLAKNYLVRPITEYYWNTNQPEIFLNSYQQKRAFTELQDFEEKIYFESLILAHSSPSTNFHLYNQEEIQKISNMEKISKGQDEIFKPSSITQMPTQKVRLVQSSNRISSFNSLESLPLTNEKNFDNVENRIIDSENALVSTSLIGFNTYGPEFFSESVQNRLHEKILELAMHYNEESIEAITNFFADLISFSSLCYLFFALEIQINITKSFLLEVFFGLDDSKKSLFILFLTDLLVGYHSPNIWELFFSSFFDHYGLPESQTTIFLLVATLPVLLDVLFKYLIFRHLNRASPATVATYHAMIE